MSGAGRFLVTGGAGLIGSHIVELLVKADDGLRVSRQVRRAQPFEVCVPAVEPAPALRASRPVDGRHRSWLPR